MSRFPHIPSAARSAMLRLAAWGCMLLPAASLPAQGPVHTAVVIAPASPHAAVKPMLGAVVRTMPAMEVNFDQERWTLHFAGTGPVPTAELAPLLLANGFLIVQMNGPDGGVAARAPAATGDSAASPDDPVRFKEAYMKAHPELFQQAPGTGAVKKGTP